MPITYDLIKEVVLGNSISTVDFFPLPTTYTDLVIVGTGYNATADGYSPRYRFNFDSGTNYTVIHMGGNATSKTCGKYNNDSVIYCGVSSGFDTNSADFGMFETHIFDYNNTTTHKSLITRFSMASGTYSGTEMICGTWRSTAAITSITIRGDFSVSQRFAAGTTFRLYGIKAA